MTKCFDVNSSPRSSHVKERRYMYARGKTQIPVKVDLSGISGMKGKEERVNWYQFL